MMTAMSLIRTMTLTVTMRRARHFAVLLNGRRTGVLHALEDLTWFVLDQSYAEDSSRAVLGLRFEQDLKARHRANMRLPPWFSNLLPEGQLREWIALQRGVSIVREVELLAEVGTDLPGAVTVVPTDDESDDGGQHEVLPRRPSSGGRTWRFSLAGVQLKFSMLKSGERFTAPAAGEGGDWIIKLPDFKYENVPRNEFTMMELARASGIDIPETRLVRREDLAALPTRLWPATEEVAYAVRRFDRGPKRELLHMEDLAQVRGFYPDDKYRGTFETVASLIYRRHDHNSLIEFIRRLAFNVLVRNADAHLKNWSLLYRDPRIPQLSPAYDLVSTAVYPEVDRDLGLRLGGSRRFEDVTLATFDALQAKLGVNAPAFSEVADEVVTKAINAWPSVEETLAPTTFGKALASLLTTNANLLRRKPA